MTNKPNNAVWRRNTIVLSLMLIFVALPHTLEDFALGEPAKNGLPAPLLAGIIAGLFALQGLALYYLGSNKRPGYFIHMGIGIFWPLAAGSAQLPIILTLQPFRSGLISLLYVLGMIILGLLLFLASIQGLRSMPTLAR